MLRKARFKNFTCVPNDTWLFAPGLNVIVGENGLGKTHVLKALYAMLKVRADAKDLSKSLLEKAYADKLVGVFRPESLGRLAKRKQGRERCELHLSFDDTRLDAAIGFATNAKSQVEVLHLPSQKLELSPVYFPPRELVTLAPWFVSLYDNFHVEFEETWRDTVSMLGNPLRKGPREKEIAKLLQPLEDVLGGKVVVDAQTGRFYLQIPAEGRMEMPLVAEGLRKIAMLAHLISSGTLLEKGFLFWDEPEANLNPKLIKTVAKSIAAIAAKGVQVFIATHSLFLMREIEIFLSNHAKDSKPLYAHFFGLHDAGKDGVRMEQADDLAGIGSITALEESLLQSDRYLAAGD